MSSSNLNLERYTSLSDMCQSTIKKFGPKTAFTGLDCHLSFSDVEKLASSFSSYLQNEMRIEKGDRVAVMLPNVLHFPVVVLAGLQIGATMVCVNPLYTPREVIHILNDCEPKVIVVLENFLHVFNDIPTEVLPKSIVVARATDFFSVFKKPIANFVLKYIKKAIEPYKELERHISWSSALSLGDSHKFREVRVTVDDLAFLQYTGGTTGRSKAAMLTHGNILSNVMQATSWVEQFYSGLDKYTIATPLPLYHIFSLTANFFTFFNQGSHNLLIVNPRDLQSFIKDWKKYPVDMLTGVNTLFNALIHEPSAQSLPYDRLKVVLGGGMAVQKSVAEKWLKMTGVPIIEAYGLTEASPAVCIHRFDREQFDGSIGYPVPGTQVRVVDDAGDDVEIGSVGELWVKGPQVMQGYWNNPSQTELTLTKDGWLKTGDLASLSEDGLVFIVDRKKDLIIVSGFNVYPNEVEDIIVSHPDVSECAVVGVSNPNNGETVKAFIVVEPGSEYNQESLLEYCRSHLAAYKVPKIFETVEVLPKNNVGKVLRRDLRAAQEAQINRQ